MAKTVIGQLPQHDQDKGVKQTLGSHAAEGIPGHFPGLPENQMPDRQDSQQQGGKQPDNFKTGLMQPEPHPRIGTVADGRTRGTRRDGDSRLVSQEQRQQKNQITKRTPGFQPIDNWPPLRP